jgi:hypothetical protein
MKLDSFRHLRDKAEFNKIQKLASLGIISTLNFIRINCLKYKDLLVIEDLL